ncbi:MAG TPA: hypothetical protein VFS02_14540 [Telluria sp.]|nr:hypothetical protein [Telluria sp.]
MTRSPDRLYQLLPAYHRMRDEERGLPLRALMRVMNEQADALEDDIAQLYRNSFIETCADWAVPYIGDLVGYSPVHDAGEAGAGDASAARIRVLIPRREVADTIALRRRKGTLALLEVLANDVAGWPARAVEFYKLLGWTQHLNHLHLARGRSADLRHGDALERLGGPLDPIAHTVDVRRVASRHSQGRHNIVTIGLFVFRLRSNSVTHAPAYLQEGKGGRRYSFSVLGNDAPLFVRPVRESSPQQIAREINLPVPIRRRALQESDRHGAGFHANDALYGEGKSVSISALNWPREGAAQPIPGELVIVADLSDWQHFKGPRGKVALDPELGRIAFPEGGAPRSGVSVSYQYGFSADIGGGEYQRTLSQAAGSTVYLVGAGAPYKSVNAALAQWQHDKRQAKVLAAVIEITDSAAYTESLLLTLAAGESLQIRAANRKRPVLRLLDQVADRPDGISISGGAGSRLVLDGLLVTGRGVRVSGSDGDHHGHAPPADLCDVRIRHCTLVPGWGLQCDCEPRGPDEPSIEMINTGASLRIERSIVGSILVTADEVRRDPVAIEASDSIIDATNVQRVALSASDQQLAFATVRILRCTVIGALYAHAIALAENSILLGDVRVGRRQIGCMRFCYVPPDSRTPRRFACQPDLAEQAAAPAAVEAERLRVQPQFTSLRYSRPGYCQLHVSSAPEIGAGADDEAEMGVFHDLFQPQRAASLRTRLNEYTPAAMQAGIIFGN